MADNLLANPQNLAAAVFASPGGIFTAFVVGPWYLVEGSVVTGQSDPQGGTGAFQLVESTALENHGWFQRINKPAQTITYRASAYVKGNGRNVELVYWDSGGLSGSDMIINGTTGAILVGPESFGSNFAFGPATVVAAGNGYFLVTFDTTIDASVPNFVFSLQGANGTVDNYTGDGVSGLFAWSPSLIVMPTPMPSRVIRI